MIGLSTGPIKNVAVIGAHCDDIMIGAGATLLEMIAHSPDVVVHALVLTGADTEREVEEKNAFAALCHRAQIDLAILPIGAYDPYIHAHASPEQSWAMRREMNATYILPMHHSTFRLSREPVAEPISRLLRAAGEERWRVALTEPGQTWRLPKAVSRSGPREI